MAPESVLRLIWKDSSMHDVVVLEGNDGLRLPVNSAVLVTRGKIFRKLLQQTEDQVIQMSYCGGVLLAVVEFCHTNAAQVLEEGVKEDGQIEDSSDALGRFQTLLLLTDAASHFGCFNPMERTQDCMPPMPQEVPCSKYPSWSCRHAAKKAPWFQKIWKN